MVWYHCDTEILDDDSTCDVCGVAKQQWTVQIDATRVFTVGVPKATLLLKLRSESGAPLPGVRYTVSAVGGLVINGTFNEAGEASIKRLSVGPCTVALPEHAPDALVDPECLETFTLISGDNERTLALRQGLEAAIDEEEPPAIDAELEGEEQPLIEADIDYEPEPMIDAAVDGEPEPMIDAAIDGEPEPMIDAAIGTSATG